MIVKILNSIHDFVDSVSSEISYWGQIKELRDELNTVHELLSDRNQEKTDLIMEVAKLTDKLDDTRSQLEITKAGYKNLLKDHLESAEAHRQFKREALEKIQQLEDQCLTVKF